MYTLSLHDALPISGLSVLRLSAWQNRNTREHERSIHGYISTVYWCRRSIAHRDHRPGQNVRLDRWSGDHEHYLSQPVPREISGLASSPTAPVRYYPLWPARDWPGRRLQTYLWSRRCPFS